MHSLSQEQLTRITTQLYSQLPGVGPAPNQPGTGFTSPNWPAGAVTGAPHSSIPGLPVSGAPLPGTIPSPLQTPPHPQQIPSWPSGVNQFSPTVSPSLPPTSHTQFVPSNIPSGPPTPFGPTGIPSTPPSQFGSNGVPSSPHAPLESTGVPHSTQHSLFGVPMSFLEPGDPLPLVTHLLASAGKKVAERQAHSPGYSLQPAFETKPAFGKTRSVPAEPASSRATGSGGEGLRNFVTSTQGTHLNRGGLTRSPFAPEQNSSQLFNGRSPLRESSRPFDVASIRQDFPILNQKVHGKPLVWLDNAATTQKPNCVIDAISEFYRRDNSNIHRAAHTLAGRATDAYEGAREKVQKFLGAGSPSEIVFVRGTTEGINLIAQTCGRKFLQPGDEILLTVLEHHANIVPWQLVAKETGAVIRVAPVNDAGEIILEDYERLLGPRTRLVAFAHANNSLGTLIPVETLTKMAKRYGARVLIDGAQSVAHIPVNVQQLDCDFYVFSGHKIFGPTGIGAVYVKEELLDLMPPWQGGGSMIKDVTFEETVYSDPPAKFEAGTPNIADAHGLGAALDYVTQLGLPNIARYEHYLLEYATERLRSINGLRLVGTARDKVGVLSFVLPNRSTAEIGKLLDAEGIAVRSGHHCAQPSLRRMGLETTVRPSLSIYNTTDEIDHLVATVKRIAQNSP